MKLPHCACSSNPFSLVPQRFCLAELTDTVATPSHSASSVANIVNNSRADSSTDTTRTGSVGLSSVIAVGQLQPLGPGEWELRSLVVEPLHR